MKKIAFVLAFVCLATFISSEVFDVSKILVKVDLGAKRYFAKTKGGYSSSFSEVEDMYCEGATSDIGYGKYLVAFKWLSESYYEIRGTSFVLEIKYASRYELSSYLDDYILDTTAGYYGQVYPKK